jgi:hypothetical protein
MRMPQTEDLSPLESNSVMLNHIIAYQSIVLPILPCLSFQKKGIGGDIRDHN